MKNLYVFLTVKSPPESDSAMKTNEKNQITTFFLQISWFPSLGHRDFSAKLERVVAPPKC